MKKYVILLLPCILLTGCSLSGKLEKKCVLETPGTISSKTTYDIKFKYNKNYEIIKTVQYSSDDTNSLKIIMDTYKIEADNLNSDYITYELGDNSVTKTYDVKHLNLEDYQDIKKTYTEQKEYLEDLGFECE